MDYSKIEPGIELDKLVAEKVLGWYQDSDVGGPRDWWFKDGKEGDSDEEALYLNRFSTDMRAAWNLAEKFRLCVTPWRVTPWRDDRWTAVQEGMIFVDGNKNAAPTAAHAICLAVLNIISESNG